MAKDYFIWGQPTDLVDGAVQLRMTLANNDEIDITDLASLGDLAIADTVTPAQIVVSDNNVLVGLGSDGPEGGGAAEIVVGAGLVYTGGVLSASGGAPGAHKTSHQDGGSDEISVAGLSGLLADAQTPLAHTQAFSTITSAPSTLAGYGITDGATDAELAAHEADTTGIHGIANTANLILEGDARLADARTPTAHAASHKLLGSDPILLNEFGNPTGSVEFNQQQALQFRIENRTNDPVSPAVGQIWLRTDL